MNLRLMFTSFMAIFTITAHPLVAPTAPKTPHVLATQEYSLTNRYRNQYVNDIFTDNILLTLSYMNGFTKTGEKVDWQKVRTTPEYQFTLEPGKTFAFHDQIADTYKKSVTTTTHAHFDSTQGFKSDGWLVGDGVCHLASFLNVVATAAGLHVDAPTRHDFAAIPNVTRQFGTAIYYVPGDKYTSSKQNLYVTNTTTKTIAFVFHHTPANTLQIAVEQLN